MKLLLIILKIKGSIDSSFGIRCPESIISGSGALYDFEGMSYDDSAALNETAFCGKTASKGSILLLWNQNISMNNNYVSTQKNLNILNIFKNNLTIFFSFALPTEQKFQSPKYITVILTLYLRLLFRKKLMLSLLLMSSGIIPVTICTTPILTQNLVKRMDIHRMS